MSKQAPDDARHAAMMETLAKLRRQAANIREGKPVAVYWAELVERTVQQLGSRAKEKIRLIRFLADQDQRSASLKLIVKSFYRQTGCDPKGQEKAERAARRHAERTREHLEVKGCPLRLDISDSVVKLIDAS